MTTDDELHALTGAFLIDALPGEERLAFEAHLDNCRACRDEVAYLQEATPHLATAELVPPAGMRDRIVQQARHTPQEQLSGERPSVGSAAASPWPFRLTAAAAAVLLVAVGGLSYTLINLTDELQQTRVTADRFADVLAAPDVAVSSAQGVAGATGRVVASASRDEALIVVNQLAPAPADRTYQLWLIAGDRATSAGLFDTGPDGRAVRPLTTELTHVDAVGISLEPAGGSPRPTTDPVLAIELH